MPTLLGNTSSSSLIKSATTLAKEVQDYQDQVQALEYANSAFTDEAYAKYREYLNSRISTLNKTGGVVNASKALTLTKTLEGATHNNISASILRENIQVMAGNATPTDKYNVIVNQYRRAVSNGDFTLAQSLENQAYSLSQTIQQQAQQSADAAATLAKSAITNKVSYEGEVVSNLKEALKSFTATAKLGSERELNTDLAKYVNDPTTKKTLQTLGVKINGSQPNYWDVVSGIAGAIYNHSVLKAQAESATNPLVARIYASQAQDMLTGATKFDTLGGSLTVLQIQQAQQDPNMFSYNNTTGKYERNLQTGYQYMTFTDQNGQSSKQLVPQYSSYPGSQRKEYNKVYFLTPQETTTMTKLGLDFSENKSKTTGNGVQVQTTQDTPQWLRSILGEGGLANFYTDSNGFVTFEAGGTNNRGPAYYTLATDNKGLAGVYEHTANGETNFVGGDYGFAANAVQLLVNKGQQVQQQIVFAQQQAQEALKVKQQQAQAAALKVTAPAPHAPSIQPTASPLPKTVAPQLPTFNPQGPKSTVNPQPSGVNPFNLPANSGSVAGTFRL